MSSWFLYFSVDKLHGLSQIPRSGYNLKNKSLNNTSQITVFSDRLVSTCPLKPRIFTMSAPCREAKAKAPCLRWQEQGCNVRSAWGGPDPSPAPAVSIRTAGKPGGEWLLGTCPSASLHPRPLWACGAGNDCHASGTLLSFPQCSINLSFYMFAHVLFPPALIFNTTEGMGTSDQSSARHSEEGVFKCLLNIYGKDLARTSVMKEETDETLRSSRNCAE